MAQGSQASIVKVAGAGFRLSLLLNAAACQLAQSRLEIHSIAKGISLYALALKQVGQTIEGTDVDQSSEATEKVWEIAEQGQLILIEIEHMLDKLKVTDNDNDLMRIPLQERLKWCFRKHHVTYLLAQLESLKLSLIVMLQILQLGKVVKSSVDKGVKVESLTPTADDTIAQEKAESQNMIIVRYWSIKRLDRLWDLVEQENLDAPNDPTNQRIRFNYSSNLTSAWKPLAAATRRSDPTRLPIVTFGDSDVGLSDVERSSKDMVQLSESTLNRLLLLWVPLVDPSKLHHAGKGFNKSNKLIHPRVYVFSDTEEDDVEGLDFDSHGVRGYYLEGSTVDWRHPHSQEARRHAAELRQKYSSYQARVESELEPDEFKHRDCPHSNSGVTNSSDEDEQRSDPLRPSHSTYPIPGRHFHSNSVSSYPPSHNNFNSRSPTYPSGSSPPLNHALHPPPLPSQTQPGPPQPPYKYYENQDYTIAPGSIPMNVNQPQSPAINIPNTHSSPRGPSPNQVHSDTRWARNQAYNIIANNKLQPRHHPSAYPLSSSSPESSFRPSPSRRFSREDAKDRHKSLTRNATRGLAGIGAIAGFLDALEVFSIL
ncbi:hypothetical protein Pdw03_2578 [Penicillium digitatum]|uniref:Uncharacterized protein n=3 Tax=Penicillium digitatum TaxID=36651 RepID=K9GD60_PEND2|nr:hypothetical protein PDIP_21430 [Penicillium digitatum Pd1]EKV11211.1 hypothetical protein PDIG_52230 [Penicillium digitatum PHI26]EKV19986.1 hypothetical protein PDIP_21430 [Penicillium digitatum Pd1]KAG0153202.1 hypothetical protein PDIDSM_5052 [Penicillium digitatum]QQK39724.1 hypothetical protein Pdw03_2578 [Penicillium digitatum]